MNFIDTETFNEKPITHGTYAYTSTCEPMIVTYALGDTAPVNLWDITENDSMPGDLEYVLDEADELLCAHSAMFDRNVLKYGLHRDIAIERWRCSMVKALAHGFPGGLDILSQIFKLGDKSKHKDGRKLIHLFCQPRPKNTKIRRATRHTHPAEWKQFCDYAVNDIHAAREVYLKLPEWNYRGSELALWHLDQKINDRGLYVDVPFAEAAIKAVARAQKSLAARTVELTDGEVSSTTKRDQLLIYLVQAYGLELPDLQMDTIERRLNDADIPVELRELLSIRLAASSTSTGKYAALVRGVMPDNRLRGTLQFDGAARTRRPAGRTFQPTNLPRPDLPQEIIESGIEAVTLGVEDLVVDDVMRLTRNAIRGAIIAPPHKKLVVSDLANIEGRDAAWLAGEEWKLQAFRDFDAGTGADLYKLAYARAFNVDVDDVDDHIERQIGKVMELMLQYGGGVGAFVTGAETYRIDLDVMTRAVFDKIPADVMEEARGMWAWCLEDKHHERLRFVCGLPYDVFLVCDSLKRMWRRRHPAIVSLWKEMEDAMRQAYYNPGTTVICRKFKMRRSGDWLRIMLPSGNFLCYPSVQVSDSGVISYMGMNQYSRRWSRIATYGGKAFENACQGFAGDLLRYQWPAIEEAGYELLLNVYDENVTETPDTDDYSAEELSRLMVREIPYAVGLPLAAKGYEAQRYRKD